MPKAFKIADHPAYSPANGAYNSLVSHDGQDTIREETDNGDTGSEPRLHSSAPVLGMPALEHKVTGADAETRPTNSAVIRIIKYR